MNQSLVVSSVMTKISLPKTKLESDINKRNSHRCNKHRFVNVFLRGYETISWQFLYTDVSGDVEIVLSDREDNKFICLDIPAATVFLAGCTKGKNGSYKLALGTSLS